MLSKARDRNAEGHPWALHEGGWGCCFCQNDLGPAWGLRSVIMLWVGQGVPVSEVGKDPNAVQEA